MNPYVCKTKTLDTFSLNCITYSHSNRTQLFIRSKRARLMRIWFVRYSRQSSTFVYVKPLPP